VLPFVAWLFIMQMLGDPAGWKYAVRSVLCVGLLVYLKPWQYYPRLQLRNIPLAIGVGLLVFLAWILFETHWMGAHLPQVKEMYQLVAMQPPWKIAEINLDRTYAPEIAGWHFTILRILGSAFVIAVIEEFFWRGFLYRWMFGDDFLGVDPGRFQWKYFLLVALFFGLEHFRWAAGIVAGIGYGWLYIRTRDIWAASIAHIVTNLVLGIYVVWADQYVFWS
jgi:CAAX prenyl protease-like protein